MSIFVFILPQTYTHYELMSANKKVLFHMLKLMYHRKSQENKTFYLS